MLEDWTSRKSAPVCVCVCVPMCADIPGEVLRVGKIKGKNGEALPVDDYGDKSPQGNRQCLPGIDLQSKGRRAPEKSSEQKLPLDKCLPSAQALNTTVLSH